MFSHNFPLFGWGIKLPQNSKENNHQCSNTTGTSFKPGTSKILFKSSLCHIWYFPDRDIVRTSYTFYHRFTNRIFANDSLHLEFTDRNTLHRKFRITFLQIEIHYTRKFRVTFFLRCEIPTGISGKKKRKSFLWKFTSPWFNNIPQQLNFWYTLFYYNKHSSFSSSLLINYALGFYLSCILLHNGGFKKGHQTPTVFLTITITSLSVLF